MERYMLHLENRGHTPRDSRDIVHRARSLCEGTGASVRVARVATRFVELDVSVDPAMLDGVVERLRPIGGLDNARHVAEEEATKEEGIRDGVAYFNAERFWEAHEAWEGAWKKCSGGEKSLVQGLILVAVSFAHAQKDDAHVGINMFSRALEKIGGFRGSYMGIDVDRVRGSISAIRRGARMEPFRI